MSRENISIKELADRVDATYEHARKIVRGVASPGKQLLPRICEELRLDGIEMQKLDVADRLERKFGGIPHELAGRNAELALIEPYWTRLTGEQKKLIELQMKTWVELNLSDDQKRKREEELKRYREQDQVGLQGFEPRTKAL